MKSDVITVSSRGSRMGEALAQAEKVAVYKGCGAKETMHLRLLTEEMMGMMRSITGQAEGEFWIENEEGRFEIHLRVNTDVDEKAREELLAVSTTGVNEAAKGFMGKIRAFFEPTAGVPAFRAVPMAGTSPQAYGSMAWSMEDYREQLDKYEDRQASREAWDELEKSVVARLADDVKIYIRGRTVEMTIVKKAE